MNTVAFEGAGVTLITVDVTAVSGKLAVMKGITSLPVSVLLYVMASNLPKWSIAVAVNELLANFSFP